MDCNIWHFKCRSTRYYILHPWAFIKDVFRAVKYAHQRCTRGYADSDWYNISEWFINVLPNMIDDLAENHCGYPGECFGFTDEDWTKYLKEIVWHLHNASEDQDKVTNEYEEEWEKINRERFSNAEIWTDENGSKHKKVPELTESQLELCKKYTNRCREIYDWRCEQVKIALLLIGSHFFNLWD